MKRLAAICARGGSKGVKGKNLRKLAGKPLIAHTIEQAKESALFAAVAVSSDSTAILEAARELGADHTVERPPALATDTAPKVPVIRHCAETVEAETGMTFETIVDLDITAPLRSTEDIQGVIGLLEESGAANVVSATPARRSPYFNLVELDDNGRVHLSKPPAKKVSRRQDSPECFDLNASVYAWSRKALFSNNDTVLGDDTRIYVMAEERSIDIDTEMDFRFVEFLMTLPESTA